MRMKLIPLQLGAALYEPGVEMRPVTAIHASATDTKWRKPRFAIGIIRWTSNCADGCY